MKIAIDATPLSATGTTGTGRYILALLAGLARRPEGKDVLVVLADTRVHLRLPEGHRFRVDLVPRRGWLGPLARETARQIDLRRLVQREGVDVLHATLDPVRPMRRCRQVLTLHDVARGVTPGLAVDSPRQRLRTAIRYRLARRADRIVTVSEFSRGQIVQRLEIPLSRISVVHTGLDSALARPADTARVEAVRARYDLPGEFFLFVGEFGRQKNEGGLIAAWRRLRERGGGIGLVLVGNGPLNATGEGDLRILRDVPDEDLPALYAAARALALPSFHEGFGLPVLEAMAQGTPVVVSRGGAPAEIAGDAGILVDPGDTSSIAEGLARALAESGEEDRRMRCRARAAEFTVEKMAERTIAAYREALGG